MSLTETSAVRLPSAEGVKVTVIVQVAPASRADVLIKTLTAAACAAAIASLVLLAVIRGSIMAQQVRNATPVITFDGTSEQSKPQQDSFYDRTTPILQLVMALLAFAMELGAGLALHEAWRLSSETTEDWANLRARLTGGRARLVLVASEITMLEREPQVFVEQFWRNFYRAMITESVRSAGTKLMVGLLAFLVAVQGCGMAQSHSAIVVALDLTKSVNVRCPGGKSEFQKNVEGVTNLLAEVPADSRITILGITNHSFSQPDILLSATIPADPGYFGERLSAARSELTKAWKAKSQKLEPTYRQTDIIGALVLAGQIFEGNGSPRKLLVIYSDMRNSTPELNLESRTGIPMFEQVGRNLPSPDLRGAEVLMLGVDGVGMSVGAWGRVKEFWKQYFTNLSARLTDYSALRLRRLPTE